MNIKQTVLITLGNGDSIDTNMTVAQVHALAQHASCLYDEGHRIKAIKHARAMFSCGLREAKVFCEESYKGE